MSTLRKAKIQDVKGIHSLVLKASTEGDGMVLPRPLVQIYSHLRDFFIACDGPEIRGCCALSVCWENLAEIRSLMVEREERGKGLGQELVKACLDEAPTLGITKVFVLTDQPKFFARFGFTEVSKDTLPQKIWADCLECHRFPDCDEIAMALEL